MTPGDLFRLLLTAQIDSGRGLAPLAVPYAEALAEALEHLEHPAATPKAPRARAKPGAPATLADALHPAPLPRPGSCAARDMAEAFADLSRGGAYAKRAGSLIATYRKREAAAARAALLGDVGGGNLRVLPVRMGGGVADVFRELTRRGYGPAEPEHEAAEAGPRWAPDRLPTWDELPPDLAVPEKARRAA